MQHNSEEHFDSVGLCSLCMQGSEVLQMYRQPVNALSEAGTSDLLHEGLQSKQEALES
jgi:hypothetical protein